MTEMKCVNCGNWAKEVVSKIGDFTVKAWRCDICKEEYIDTEDAQRILLFNKLKNQVYKVTVEVHDDNYVLQIPKKIAEVIGIHQGELTTLKLTNKSSFEVSVA